MCMRTSSPTVYKRPNPQDIYYNGNIYDPIEEEKKKPAVTETAPKEKQGGGNSDKNPMLKSNTGLQIY